MRAIGYCRVSTKDQSQHGTSLGYQRKKISECMEKMDWDNIGIYEDDQTGTQIDSRKNMKKVLNMVEEWDVLVITKPDRLSRSFGDAENMFKNAFEPKHKNVWSVEMNINLTNHPEMRQFKSVIADMEVRNIRSRVNQGFESASEGGYWIGKPPYGYKTQSVGTSYKDRKILVPDVETMKDVNTVFHYASEGYPHSEISRNVGIPRTTVIDMLNNPVYYGYRKLTRTILDKDKNDLIISSERVVRWVEHDYEIIVNQDYLDSCFKRYKIGEKIKR